jgi:beta-galactosidase
VRWERAPGPLRAAAGFSYQEFSNLDEPLALKGDPFHAGDQNKVSTWAEFLLLETARPLAFYDHPFFGRWPAVTSNHYGAGTLTYEGTVLSDKLQQAIMLSALHEAGLDGPDQQLPPSVRVKHGVSRSGHAMHYYLNYSGAPAMVSYSYPEGTDLLTGDSIATGKQSTLAPWGVAIVEEKAAAAR